MYKMYFQDGGQDCFSKHSYLSLGSFHGPDFGITINSFIVSSVSIAYTDFHLTTQPAISPFSPFSYYRVADSSRSPDNIPRPPSHRTRDTIAETPTKPLPPP